MLKLIKLSRCTFSIMASSQPLNLTVGNPVLKIEQIKTELWQHRDPVAASYDGCRKKYILIRANTERIKAVKEILEKYNIDMNHISKDKMIFQESPWIIEKRILLLQELGVPKITTNLIANFVRAMNLSVNIFKANACIDPETNFAKNLFSYTEAENLDYNFIDDSNGEMQMKKYYSDCFIYFLKNRFVLNESQLKSISYKKHQPILYNSFNLMNKIIKFVKNDLKFSDNLLIRNYWLFGHHPAHAKAVCDILKNDLEVPFSIFIRYPKLLEYDIIDLKNFTKYIKHYGFTPKMINTYFQIFHLHSGEFKQRVENLLKNPFTLVYQKHPRFLALVRDYYVILPRIRYLQEKNLKYATIHSLTTFHNYLENLINSKKTTRLNLRTFCEAQFGDEAEQIVEALKRHPCYAYVSLLQMYETYHYLKEYFSKKVIHRHVYAILYNKTDVKTAYENVLEDPINKKLTSSQLLALCIYKIEERFLFTGDGVLPSEKHPDISNEEVNTNTVNSVATVEKVDSKEDVR